MTNSNSKDPVFFLHKSHLKYFCSPIQLEVACNMGWEIVDLLRRMLFTSRWTMKNQTTSRTDKSRP